MYNTVDNDTIKNIKDTIKHELNLQTIGSNQKLEITKLSTLLLGSCQDEAKREKIVAFAKKIIQFVNKTSLVKGDYSIQNKGRIVSFFIEAPVDIDTEINSKIVSFIPMCDEFGVDKPYNNKWLFGFSFEI